MRPDILRPQEEESEHGVAESGTREPIGPEDGLNIRISRSVCLCQRFHLAFSERWEYFPYQSVRWIGMLEN